MTEYIWIIISSFVGFTPASKHQWSSLRHDIFQVGEPFLGILANLFSNVNFIFDNHFIKGAVLSWFVGVLPIARCMDDLLPTPLEAPFSAAVDITSLNNYTTFDSELHNLRQMIIFSILLHQVRFSFRLLIIAIINFENHSASFTAKTMLFKLTSIKNVNMFLVYANTHQPQSRVRRSQGPRLCPPPRSGDPTSSEARYKTGRRGRRCRRW